MDKYEKAGEGYLKKMFDLLQKYSSNPIEDSLKLWRRAVFSFMIGNTDNHIKNSSIIYSKDLSSIRLAPFYDVVCTRIYEISTDEVHDGIKKALLDSAEELLHSGFTEVHSMAMRCLSLALPEMRESRL